MFHIEPRSYVVLVERRLEERRAPNQKRYAARIELKLVMDVADRSEHDRRLMKGFVYAVEEKNEVFV